MGIVNGANSFISRLSVLANGKELYQCNYAKHSVNIKNLLEYNKSYADSVATNEFYFLDTSKTANKNRFFRREVTHRRNEAGNADGAGLMLDNASYLLLLMTDFQSVKHCLGNHPQYAVKFL